MTTDFKKPARIRDPDARNRKLLADPMCRCGCGARATDGHHILRRDLGDDVEDNIMPLAHACHMRYHDARLRHLELTGSERGYLLAKLGTIAGEDYISRRYG